MKTLTNNMNRWQAFFLAFVLFIAAPFTARAQDALKPGDAKAYSDLLKAAQDAADNNRFAEAIELWHKAWNIQPHWHLPCYIGTGHFLLQRPDKATTYLKRCEKLAPFPTTEKGLEHRRKEREMLTISLSHVATVAIVAPQGARVSVDNEDKGTAPHSEEIYLMPGEHRFIAELNGKSASRTIKTNRNEKITVDLAFPDEQSAPMQSKPQEPRPPQSKPIEIKPIPIRTPLPIALNSAPSPWMQRWAPSFVLLGAGAVLGGAGVLTHAKAQGYADSVRDIEAARDAARATGNASECNLLQTRFEETRADYRQMIYLSIFSYGAAGALGIAGLVYPWLPIHGKSASIAVSNSSVLIRGSF